MLRESGTSLPDTRLLENSRADLRHGFKDGDLHRSFAELHSHKPPSRGCIPERMIKIKGCASLLTLTCQLIFFIMYQAWGVPKSL